MAGKPLTAALTLAIGAGLLGTTRGFAGNLAANFENAFLHERWSPWPRPSGQIEAVRASTLVSPFRAEA